MEFLAKNLYGNSVTLHDLSVTTLNEAHFQQMWQCINTEVTCSCWNDLFYSGLKVEDELPIALDSCFDFKGSTHYLIKVNDTVAVWVRLINQYPTDQVIDLANIFSPLIKQSTASTEAIYL